jgi:antitoxin component YwqK of YwqJK toxin-antitoxin module
MEIFEQVKTSLIEQAKAHNPFSNQLELVIEVQTWDKLQKVICDEIRWFFYHNINLPNGHYKNNKREFTVLNDKLNGEFIRYRKDGTVCEKCTYVDGVKHGEFIRYHEDGTVCEKCTYVNGVKHGEYFEYHENGQVYKKCNYVHGKTHGEYVLYHDNEQLWFKCNFVHGELVETAS